MTHENNGKKVERAAQQLLELVESQEEEEQQVRKRKQKMMEEIERKKREISRVEMEKTKLDAEIMALRLRDKAYQREHSDLRNAITVIKFQIEKIKESVEKTKEAELEDLREFERAVDEITEKFRSSPAIYDRRSLSQKLEEEREKGKLLLQRVQEAREAYANFNREKGLRERSNEDEDLLHCVLPGSQLYYLIEMTKNLDEVISGMRQQNKGIKEKERELEQLDAKIKSLNAKIAASTTEPAQSEGASSERGREDSEIRSDAN